MDETKFPANATALAVWNSTKANSDGSVGGWDIVGGPSGASKVLDYYDLPVVSETMSFGVVDGDPAIAVGAAPTITAANIPRVTTIPTGRRRLIIDPSWAEVSDGAVAPVASCTVVGLLFGVNVGNQELMSERAKAFADPAKQCLRMTGSAATTKTVVDTGILYVPKGERVDMVFDEDMSDFYGAIALDNGTVVNGAVAGAIKFLGVSNA